MSDQTLQPPEPEREPREIAAQPLRDLEAATHRLVEHGEGITAEPTHYVPKWNGDLTSCGLDTGRAGKVTFAVGVTTCRACLDAIERITPLPDVTDWAAMSNEQLEQRLRDSAARVLDGMDAATPDAEVLALQLRPEPTHFDPDRMDRLTPCGLDVPDIGAYATTDPARVTCPVCVSSVVDSQLPPEPVDQPVNDPATDLAKAEHRTVGLEVLTPQLRAAEDARRIAAAREENPYGVGEDAADLLNPDAVVGIVLHLNGEPVLVPEVDTSWRARYRRAPDLLAALLRQARFYADDHDDAELLMPTPDVLAALAGEPVGRYTAAVQSKYAFIQPGWFVSIETRGPDGPGQQWLLVEDTASCPDPAECAVAAGEPSDCRVFTIRGRGVQHLPTYMPAVVRIPASTEVEQP